MYNNMDGGNIQDITSSGEFGIVTLKKRKVQQYVIVAHKDVIIRPFGSMKEAKNWAKSYAGVTEDTEHFIQVVEHIDIASRFNLK